MRRIIVCVKRVVDFSVRVRVRADGTGVVTDGLKMSINPFDEIALEEALRIVERGDAEEVVAVSIGTLDAQQQLRTALAMGANRAILIETDQVLEPLAVARALVVLVNREQPLLVLLGKQAIDDDQNQTGQMLAALWDRPQATFASKIEFTNGHAIVTREVDQGLETVAIDLPGVITSDLRLNEPRYVKLPEILKAKRKPLEVIALDSLGTESAQQFTVVHTSSPEPRKRGVVVKDVNELVAALRQRGTI
jgi:electron transfer flavoprotein beta subunit